MTVPSCHVSSWLKEVFQGKEIVDIPRYKTHFNLELANLCSKASNGRRKFFLIILTSLP